MYQLDQSLALPGLSGTLTRRRDACSNSATRRVSPSAVMSIQGIDAASIHRLTSGQVVTDLQTSVKELVENSLDAGATSIDVRFKNYGLASIEVIDNGSGIAPADYDSVALKHYTSKLSTFEDIAAVRTFGFRGEALSSLCALCESVTVTTATQNEAPMGTVLEFDARGRVKSRSGKVARQRGTTVTLTKLFTPLPVRRKDLEKNAKREFGKALNLLQAYALVPCTIENGGVRFTVSNQLDVGGRKTQIQTKGSGAIQTAVTALWGPKAMDNVVPLDVDFDVEAERSVLKRMANMAATTHVRVTGLISKFAVSCGRQGSDRQYLFVNGRPCNLPKVQRAINETYRQFNATQTPFVVLNIIIPTETCDINVSPDKRTIFLHNEQNFITAMKENIERTFAEAPSTFRVNTTFLSASQAIGIQQDETEDEEDQDDQDEGEEHTRPPPPQLTSAATLSSRPPIDTRHSSPLAVSITEQPVPDRPSATFRETPGPEAPREAPLFLPDDDDPAPQPDMPAIATLTPSPSRLSEAEMDVDDDKTESVPDTPPPPPNKTVQTLLSTWALPKPSASSTTLPAKRPRSDEMMLAASSRSPRKPPPPKRLRAFSPRASPEASVVNAATVETITVDIDMDDLVASGNVETEPDEEEEPEEIAPLQGPLKNRSGSSASSPSASALRSRASTIPPDTEIVDLTDEFDQLPRRPSRETIKRPPYAVIQGRSGAGVTVSMDLEAISEAWAADCGIEDAVSEPAPTSSQGDAGLEADADVAEAKLSRIIHKVDFARMDIVGQFNLGFIIARLRDHDDDLFIIDQHASDEKYNFETLQQTTKMETQRLLRPRPLELTAADELLAIERIDVLRKNGFDLTVDEDAPAHQRVRLTAIPVSKNTAFDVQDLEELIHTLRDTAPGQTARCSKVRAMFAMRACRKSVMIGDALNMRQMKDIVLHMGTMDQPWNCPHGRPTMRHLTNLGQLNYLQHTDWDDTIDWDAFME